MNPSNLCTFGGKSYQSGLFWQILTGNSKTEVYDLGQQLNFDLVCADQSQYTSQVGFAAKSDGYAPKQTSLAMSLLFALRKKHKVKPSKNAEDKTNQTQSVNFIVALRTDTDDYYLLVVKDGIIQPDSDRLLAFPDIVSRLGSLIDATPTDSGAWLGVYLDEVFNNLGLPFKNVEAPNALKLIGSSTACLAAIKSPKDTKKQQMLLLAILAGVILVAVAAAFAVNYYLEQQRIKAEQARLDALQPPELPEGEWQRLPHALDFINGCLKHYALATVGGWEVTEFTCDGRAATLKFDRTQDGQLAPLFTQRPDFVFNDSFDSAQLQIPLDPLQPSGWSHEQFGPLEQQVIQLVSDQQHNENIAIKFTPIAQLGPAKDVPRPVYKTTFTADLSDMDARFFLAMLPAGTRIDMVDIKTNQTTLRGSIYGFKVETH